MLNQPFEFHGIVRANPMPISMCPMATFEVTNFTTRRHLGFGRRQHFDAVKKTLTVDN